MRLAEPLALFGEDDGGGDDTTLAPGVYLVRTVRPDGATLEPAPDDEADGGVCLLGSVPGAALEPPTTYPVPAPLLGRFRPLGLRSPP